MGRSWTSDSRQARNRPSLSSSWIFFVLVSALLTAGAFALTLTRPLGDLWRSQAFVHLDSTVALSSLFSDNGRTKEVEWDKYSLLVKQQRVFLHSGEFHTFRLPVPSLWPDILQKVKASGLNAISVYTHMGLANPSPGVLDFNGFRALQPLFDAAKDSGVFVVLRPGPYINAETSAGGIAHWVTSEVSSTLKTNATDYHEAWETYIHGIIELVRPNQITSGGPVIAIQIDNEIGHNPPERAAYFAELEETYRNSDIVIPLTYNDPGRHKNFINGTGAVDIYGLDSYPQGFDCSNPKQWSGVVTDYYQYHAEVNPGQPWYTPEFQGGAFDAWGPTAPGYQPCYELTGPDFQSVFNLQLWASNFKMINYYMLYGGTSWGALPFPGVYTSYDYGSAISENRALTEKYTELKRQGLFLRSSTEFYKTDWVGNSSAAAFTNSKEAFITSLRNPDTDAWFYVARQLDSTSTAITKFRMNVSTSTGEMELPLVAPHITLGGRQSKVILTNYAFGSSRALYSTAQVLFAGKIGGRDVLFLFGDSTQEHEVALKLTGQPNPFLTQSSLVESTSFKNHTILSFLVGIEGLITIWDSDEQLILFSDTRTAGSFWSPTIAGDGDGDFRNYWQLGTNNSILVGGPYLVRNATITGSELALVGDLETGVRLFVISPAIRSITWNGQQVTAESSASAGLSYIGGFIGTLHAKAELTVPIPTLGGWKYADSLPEIRQDFSDDAWTVADHTNSNIPWKPYYGDGRVLYGCDYGFCENVVLWRGHFYASGEEKYLNLSINGGQAFAASVWLNDVFLNTSYGNSTNNKNRIEETDEKFYIPEGAMKLHQDNVVTIVQDNMGLNETGKTQNEPKSPRGIRGFYLGNGTFSVWKIQGKVGGYKQYPDKTRGIFNEGGLFGERRGWHLPGLDTSSWVRRDLSAGLPDGKAGVGWFITTFRLDIARGLDVAMSFVFLDGDGIVGGEKGQGQMYRAYLYVNGWMMGKRIANLGPQFKFPVHEGILDYRGVNTVAVALWVMEPDVPISPKLELVVDKIFEGGVGGIVTNNPPWSGDGRE